MENKGLLFIPDISGFTRFVTETEIDHSRRIVQELLEAVIEANQIGLQVSEIEGDAVLFFKFGESPDLRQLSQQVERTFRDFHQRLATYELGRFCQCRACASACNLTLKIITHYGEFATYSVKSFEKLIGKDVIVAHQLLKNDIDQHEYWLVTTDLLRGGPPAGLPPWIKWHPGVKRTERGDVEFQYALLGELRQTLEPRPLRDLELPRRTKMFSASRDHLVKDGTWPALTYPRVPGHEVVGVIDAVDPGVTEWKQGDRVGVGWHGGHDFVCPSCRRGDFVTCANEAITGFTRDGGYAQYMLARHEALALLPDGLDWAEAGPLMCAGITTFNALRNSGARAGDLVGVLGIGGLGHLGIQYAAKSGYRVVGIGRGPENGALAKRLGAFAYIDSRATKAAEELQKLGGAKLILATAPNAKAIADLVDGLSVGGKLLIVGAPFEPMEVSVMQLLLSRRAIQGWPSGTAMDSQETLEFSAFAGVRPMIEKYPLAKVHDAYERMASGRAEFRVVLTVD